jgi:sulfur dioxygenase
MLIFRQLFDTHSSTYTYLLADGDRGEAVLIDPVFEHARRDAALLRELGLRLSATLETHVHADPAGARDAGAHQRLPDLRARR